MLVSSAEGERGDSTKQTWIQASDVHYGEGAAVQAEKWGRGETREALGRAHLGVPPHGEGSQPCFWKSSKGQSEQTGRGRVPEELQAQATGIYRGSRGDLSTALM